MLYVSHRLEEVFEIADRVTVMRNGRLVWTRDRAELTMPDVVEAMVGTQPGASSSAARRRRPARDAGRRRATAGAGRPRPDRRRRARGCHLHRPAGRDHRARGAGGLGRRPRCWASCSAPAGPPPGDRRAIPTAAALPRSPTEAARRGVALVPADRRNQGLMLDRSIVRNITLVSVGAHARPQPVAAARREMLRRRPAPDRPAADQGAATRDARSAACRAATSRRSCSASGSRSRPGVLLLDDPTRGVDVGAKREIYLLIRALADEGRVVLFRSTELPELVGLADRILVFYRGRLALELDGADVDRPRGAAAPSTPARLADHGAPGRPSSHHSTGGAPMIRPRSRCG